MRNRGDLKLSDINTHHSQPTSKPMKFFGLILVSALSIIPARGGKDMMIKNDGEMELGELLDPEVIVEMLPKNFDELFELLEMIIPGSKKLQPQIVRSIKAFAPLIHVRIPLVS
jgi:hypothetical protein